MRRFWRLLRDDPRYIIIFGCGIPLLVLGMVCLWLKMFGY